MDRLFLTVYAKLLAAIAGAALAALLIVAPEITRRVESNFEEMMAPSIAIAAHMLAAEQARGGDVDQAIAKLTPTFRTPAALVPASDLHLEPDAATRLARGDVILVEHMPSPVLYARVEGTGRLLRVGPLNPTHPLGEGRSFKILALVVAGLVAGVYLVLRPMRIRLAALSRVALTLGKGDLTARANVGPRDAIGDLSSALNHMAHELARQIAAQQELLHMVSHELRTPLQRLRFNAEALCSAGDDAQRDKVRTRVERDVEEVDELLGELLAYVRLGNHAPITHEDVDVHALLEALCETLSDTRGHVELLVRPSDPVIAAVDVRLIRRAVSNLVVNALAYAQRRVEVSVSRDDGEIRIRVDDDGRGIEATSRERVFEPFQRLDDERNAARKSFGLGLAIVRRVAELHGGSAKAQSSELGGARLEVVLPAIVPKDRRGQ